MNTSKLWLSQVDGHMYRDNNFETPVRKNVAYWTDKIKTVADLKAVIRASEKAFGARQLVLITSDGETLCHTCARKEFRLIADAILSKSDNGWRAIAATTDAECQPEEGEDCLCAHCSKKI